MSLPKGGPLRAAVLLALSWLTAARAGAAGRAVPGPEFSVTRVAPGAELASLHPAFAANPALLRQVQAAAAKLGAAGPVVAVRRGDSLALIGGARAAVFSVGASGATVNAALIPLNAEVQNLIADGDYASAQQALSRDFDASKNRSATYVEEGDPRAAVLPHLERIRRSVRPVPPKPVPGLSKSGPSAKPGQSKDLELQDVYEIMHFAGDEPWEPQWSPDSRSVAFLDKDGHLMLYDWEKKTSELLIKDVGLHSYPHDYAWTPKGDAILYVSNGQWTLFDIAARKSSALGAVEQMSNVAISPDGRNLAFEREGDVWVRPVAGGAERRLTANRLPTEPPKGLHEQINAPARAASVGEFEWSPDSSRIAYLDYLPPNVKPFHLLDYTKDPRGTLSQQLYSMPGDDIWKVSVGAVTVADGKNSSIPLPADTAYVDRLLWTPNNEVAVAALNRLRDKRTIVIDGKTAAADEYKRLVRESGDLLFLKDGTPVYVSDKNGRRRHIYAGERQLTSGEWNVRSIDGIDEKNGWITYTSHEGNTVENHVWRVSLDGQKRERLTSEAGWHNATVSPDGTRFLDSWSSVEKSRVVEPLQPQAAATLDAFGMKKPEFFQLPAVDGSPLDAMLLKPRDFSPSKRYPAIVYVYGGLNTQSVQNEWDGNFMPWLQMMAQKGFAILVLDNRLSGTGRADVMSRVFGRLGGMEKEDAEAGADWLARQPWLAQSPDGRKMIGGWGWSYGGSNMLYIGTHSERYAAVAAIAPVTNWLEYNAGYTEARMGLPADNAQGYQDSSPVNFAQNLKIPLLLMGGDADDNVHPTHYMNFAKASNKAGNFLYEMRVFMGQRHGISSLEDFTNLFGRLTEFFAEQLGGPQQAESKGWLEELRTKLGEYLTRFGGKPKSK